LTDLVGLRDFHYWRSEITLNWTHHTRRDSSGRRTGPSQRLLPDNT